MGVIEALVWFGLVLQTQMTQASRVEVRVLDPVGAVISGANVKLSGHGRSWNKPYTDSVGTATLYVPPGTYVLEVNAAVFKPYRRKVTITSSNTEIVAKLRFSGSWCCADDFSGYWEIPEAGTTVIHKPADYPSILFDNDRPGGMSPR